MTWTHTGGIFHFSSGGSHTITSAGKTFGGLTVGLGGADISTRTLADALTLTGSLNITSGTFTTNNYAVTATSLVSNNTNGRAINLGSSTITLSASGASVTVNLANSTGLTFNAGTSQFVLTNSTAALNASGHTFYNVRYSSTAISSVSIGGSGGNTFNNLEVVGRSSAGVSVFRLAGDQTINGTLTLSPGANATMRTCVQSTVMGTARTLTCAAFSPVDVDFRDIAIAGAASGVSGTRLGDCGGNSGITFPVAKTVYWSGSSGGSWGATTSSWSLTSGGASTHAAFPLAQDTAEIPSGWPGVGQTITINGAYNIGTLRMSGRAGTSTLTLTCTSTPVIYGDWINGTAVNFSGTGTLTFSGRGDQKITTAGRTFTQNFTISCYNGSVTLQDAFTTNRAASTAFELNAGTFSLGSYTATLSGSAAAFRADNTTLPRTFDSGTGTLVLGGTGGWSAVNATNLTVTGSGTISLTSASAKTFNGGGVQTYPTLNQGGAGALTITGSNKFANITNTYSATGATSVLFTVGTTNEFTAFNLTGTAGKVCTLGSTTTGRAFLKKSSIWYMGANSTSGNGNTNLNFAAGGGIDYLSVSYINGIGPSTSKPGNFFAFF